MNRKDVVAAMAEQAALSADQANIALGALSEVLADAARRGERVQLTGLFTLEPVHRAARTGRNPRTGEPMSIPAQRTVRIAPGSALKAAARG